MALPYFFIADIAGDVIVLNEETSKHITQALRMSVGEKLLLTDGKGKKAEAQIINDHRKQCEVTILSVQTEEQLVPKLTIAISLIKNTTRFEWFLEKATEIGINEIMPLICERTEKEKFRSNRMQNIIVSAMLQSQQCWLPLLHEPMPFSTAIKEAKQQQKLIAHCLPHNRSSLMEIRSNNDALILIGPEGDFTPKEVEAALANQFLPVSLGDTRLRTETAGIVAATLLRLLIF